MEDQEKNDVQDAQIEEVIEEKDALKKNYRTEVILILIIGLLLGVMIKAESLKKLSIGFSDYKVSGGTQGYDLAEIEKRLLEESKKAKEEANQAANPVAGENE